MTKQRSIGFALAGAGILAALIWLISVIWSPARTASVMLPDDAGQVTVEIWGGILNEGSHYLVVENAYGTASAHMWDDWGPAQRTSLYMTEAGELIAIGGGGISTEFRLRDNEAPEAVRLIEGRNTRSEDWVYLGAFDRRYLDSGASEFVFFTPSQQRECNAMFGIGSSAFRGETQEEHFCSDLDLP